MSRMVWWLLSALLVAELSGVAELLTPERCSFGETDTRSDSTCPPTCARCGCCAQPVVQIALQALSGVEPAAPFFQRFVASPPVILSRDIFHVPKPS